MQGCGHPQRVVNKVTCVCVCLKNSMRESYALPPVYGVNEGELDHRREQEYRAAQEPNFASLYVGDLRQGVLHL